MEIWEIEIHRIISDLVKYAPTHLECHAFHHAKKDQNHGPNCPCEERYHIALENARRYLVGREIQYREKGIR